MSKRKTAAFYRAALLGVSDKEGELSPGLRSVARGFSAAEGYNLRALERGEWTPAMKRRVTMYFHELQQLTAQPKVIVKTRSPSRLVRAQAIGGHDPHFDFKVAFVPGSPTATWRFDKDDNLVVHERKSKTSSGYDKVEIDFDRTLVVLDPENYIESVFEHPSIAEAQRFRIMAGPHQIKPLQGRNATMNELRHLMNQYDGHKALPRGSGNAGDKPTSHAWWRWLTGITAYKFPFDPNRVSPARATKELEAARDIQRRRKNARKREKRS